MLEVGDKVTTDFYQKEKGLVREVVSVTGGHRSESGYMVNAKDEKGRELRADMNWFTKINNPPV